jgi:hypothetical protein
MCNLFQIVSARKSVSFCVDALPSFFTKAADANGEDENNNEDEDIWQDVDPLKQSSKDVTRSGKNTSDLDHSDLKAMGLAEQTTMREGRLSPVKERSNEDLEDEVSYFAQSRLASYLILHLGKG